MLNSKKINDLINTYCFEHEDFEQFFDERQHWDVAVNPHYLKLFIEELKEDKNLNSFDTSALEFELDDLKNQVAEVTNDEIKSVFLKLKNREKNPIGIFDSQGRFYVKDRELLKDIRQPSAKYPYSLMNAARTAKFVKALVEKYKPKNLTELEFVAFDK